jgi:hypothetical protein
MGPPAGSSIRGGRGAACGRGAHPSYDGPPVGMFPSPPWSPIGPYQGFVGWARAWKGTVPTTTAEELRHKPAFPVFAPPPRAANGRTGDGEIRLYSTKLAAGLRSVARNYKATRLLTRPG